MANKDFEEPQGDGNEVPGAGDPDAAEDPTTGSDAADGSPPHEELTVEDILEAEQSDDASVADAPEEERALMLDLKRIQAEYANYRRRTEAQREVEIDRAKGDVAKALLPVLDDLDRAASHGDLEPGTPLAAIGDKLRGVTERMGISGYGEAGEAFDPQQHEAIFQQPTPGVESATVIEVVERGYRLGSVELRPAKVVVAVPSDG